VSFSPAERSFTPDQIHAMEREYLGLYVSGHPLDQYADFVRDHTNATCQQVFEGLYGNNTVVTIGGLLVEPKRMKSKTGGFSVRGIIEDLSGRIEFTCYDAKANEALFEYAEDGPVCVRAQVYRRVNNDTGVERISLTVTAVIKMTRSRLLDTATDTSNRRDLLAFGHLMVAGGEKGSGSEFMERKAAEEPIVDPETETVSFDMQWFSALSLTEIGPFLTELPEDFIEESAE
jgi:DNA polymerase III alpha subunit